MEGLQRSIDAIVKIYVDIDPVIWITEDLDPEVEIKTLIDKSE